MERHYKKKYKTKEKSRQRSKCRPKDLNLSKRETNFKLKPNRN